METNCLGFTVASLSSHDAQMRGAACYILTRFLEHLEGARFSEREQVAYVLECIKNSIEAANTKVACIITVFQARAIHIMLELGEHDFWILNCSFYAPQCQY